MTSTTDKAEHVTGIVLQPLWKTQKLDWTDRKNVFEKSSNNQVIDEQTFRERHPLLFCNENRKETAYILQKEQTERNRDRPLNPPRYRTSYHRKRWNDITRRAGQY